MVDRGSQISGEIILRNQPGRPSKPIPLGETFINKRSFFSVFKFFVESNSDKPCKWHRTWQTTKMNGNEVKSTITECHKNCQVSAGRDQKLTMEAKL